MNGDRRPTHCWYDFNGDGRFPNDRIKGSDKRFIRKRFLRRLALLELREYDREVRGAA